MKDTICLWLSVVILLACGTGLAQGGAVELATPRVASPPKIDGKLEEACWQTPPPITELRCVDKERSTPTQRTEAWVVCDGETIYVAARCAEEHMEQVLATVDELDGPVWRDDCLEVFLMPGTPYYYHFGANLLGARYDARHAVGVPKDDSKPASWNGQWQVAARREGQGWTMEIAISLHCLEWGPARVTAPLRFNLGREQRRLAEFSCWPASEFSKTAEFAKLTGVEVDPQRYGLLVKDASLGVVTPGANRYAGTIAEEPAPGAAMTLRARVRALPQGAEQTFAAQVQSTPGGQAELEYQVPLSGGRVAAVFEYLDAQGRIRASQSEVRWVPAPLEGALDLPLLCQGDGAVRLAGKVALRGAARLEAVLLSGSRQLSVTSVPVGAEGDFQVRLPVKSLSPGRYRVETRLTAPGATAEPVVNQFPFRLIAGPLD